MKVIRISHLGVAPKDINQALSFFQDTLGLSHEGSEKVEDQLVNVDFLQCEKSRLELLAPTNSESPIAKFLETRGSGIHHVALEVDNIEEWLNHLKKNKIQLIDEAPRLGAHNTKIIFIHPRATGGILVELVEESK
ncbi:MAG: methylmalonyl-CoA epimerase [Bdellovibrionota bacterium]